MKKVSYCPYCGRKIEDVGLDSYKCSGCRAIVRVVVVGMEIGSPLLSE